MQTRLLVLLSALLLVSACAPATEPAPETESAPEAEAPAEPMDDEAAIDAVRAAYVEHYNLGHADMVADLFTDDAVTLFADGGVSEGREQIEASHTTAMANDPTVQIDAAETMVMDDMAVSRGTYSVQMAPAEGEPVSFSGYYLTEFQKVGGEWKIGAVISNYDSEPPAGMPAGTMPEETPPDLVDSPLADLTAAYAEAFNAGDAAAVAALYDEDAVAAFAGMEAAEGRAAIQGALEERMAAGSPQITIHEVATMDMGDGWYVGGGWSEAATDGEPQLGHWISLVRTAEDGSASIHWMVTNTVPQSAMPDPM